MKAMDVMVRDVVTIDPDADVAEALKLLADNDVSALPVVDDDAHVLGILSEADFLERAEFEGAPQPGWLEAFTPAHTRAEHYAKAHGRKVSELMSTAVISVTEDTPLGEIAALLERHRIKRVPVLDDGKLVGIVSRGHLIQALASAALPAGPDVESDRTIRAELLAELDEQTWTDFGARNIIVVDGVVHIWGLVGSPEEHKALLALAENVHGVKKVVDEMFAAYC
jgi:CBS-domain-containing membrane protein